MALSFWFRIASSHDAAAQPSIVQLCDAQSRASLHVVELAQRSAQACPQSMPASAPF
jgi:hypothetical protein